MQRARVSCLVAWALAACVDSWLVNLGPGRRPRGLCAARCELDGGNTARRATGEKDIMAAIAPLLQDKKQHKGRQAKKKKAGSLLPGDSSRRAEISSVRALEFEREGHTLLSCLVTGAELAQLAQAVQSEYDLRATEAYTDKLHQLGVSRDAIPQTGVKAALEKACIARGLPMPSLQVYNLHRADRAASKVVREFVTSPSMGRAAADLMGVDSVM